MSTSFLSDITYWDASAAIPAVFPEKNSDVARRHANSGGLHLFSSLAWAEIHAVLARAQRRGKVSAALITAAHETLTSGPWRWINVVPDRKLIRELAVRYQLRGADLWHLAAAKTLKADQPELTLLTFDSQLSLAAEGEGLK